MLAPAVVVVVQACNLDTQETRGLTKPQVPIQTSSQKETNTKTSTRTHKPTPGTTQANQRKQNNKKKFNYCSAGLPAHSRHSGTLFSTPHLPCPFWYFRGPFLWSHWLDDGTVRAEMKISPEEMKVGFAEALFWARIKGEAESTG